MSVGRTHVRLGSRVLGAREPCLPPQSIYYAESEKPDRGIASPFGAPGFVSLLWPSGTRSTELAQSPIRLLVKNARGTNSTCPATCPQISATCEGTSERKAIREDSDHTRRQRDSGPPALAGTRRSKEDRQRPHRSEDQHQAVRRRPALRGPRIVLHDPCRTFQRFPVGIALRIGKWRAPQSLSEISAKSGSSWP